MSRTVSRRTLLSAAPVGVVLSQAGWAATSEVWATDREVFDVGHVTVNATPSPLGLEAGAIRLGWQLTSDRRACAQVAYRICVASSAEALAAGTCDIWDSGKVASGDSFDVSYKGPDIAARGRAFWTVTVWDNHGRMATSRPATWEMGLLAPGDWAAKWIAIESPEVRADREAGLPWLTTTIAKAGQTRQFRLGFRLDQDAQVTVFTGANAGHRVFLDGATVAMPPHANDSMGDQGVVETHLSLARGSHVLALSVDDLAGFGELLNGTPRGCLLAKARYASGEIVRFSGVNARASDEMPDGWAGLSFSDAAWGKARRLDGPGAAWPGTGAYLAFLTPGYMSPRSAVIAFISMGRRSTIPACRPRSPISARPSCTGPTTSPRWSVPATMCWRPWSATAGTAVMPDRAAAIRSARRRCASCASWRSSMPTARGPRLPATKAGGCRAPR